MKTKQMIFMSILMTTPVIAGAATTTIKLINDSDEVYYLKEDSRGAIDTLYRSYPVPPVSLPPHSWVSFDVYPSIFDSNYANVTLQSASAARYCFFQANYVNTRYGIAQDPSWKHSAQGGPHCRSRRDIDRPYSQTHDWGVEFIIR